MKYRFILGLPLLGLGFLLWIFAFSSQENQDQTISSPTQITPSQIGSPLSTTRTPLISHPGSKPNISEIEITHLTDKLIDQTLTYLPGKIITPQTTADLRAWFSKSNRYYMPRVFTTRLPKDFATKGDPVLYIQVIASLIMRENEQALRERIVLIQLQQKITRNLKLSPKESSFLHSLVQKYDARAKRNQASQIADLMRKVDTIPISMAITQSALATNWGKENTNHPYDQQGWITPKQYGLLSFSSLIEATQSYFKEMNGMPPLFEWRVSRDQFRDLTAKDKGYRFLPNLASYMPADRQYVSRLKEKADEMDVVAIDALQFLPQDKKILFPKGQAVFHTNNKNIPLDIEVAITPEQKAHGLMFRENIPENYGMLFINETPTKRGLWMKNTLIPLDMVFFDEAGKIIHLVEHAKPHDLTPHRPPVPMKGVIELPVGSIQKYHLKKGDTITYSYKTP